MYLDFYHLQKAPFHITPDPEFLFLSPNHKAALRALVSGIEERQGFVALISEVGLGKTTLLRSYLQRVDQSQLKTIYLANANVSFGALLKMLCRAFGLEVLTEEVADTVNRLHQVLIEKYKQGRNVALLVDEAQHMPLETLEHLHMLSNLETSTQKLIQIVLVGQPEFEAKLNNPALRQLKQRLVIRSTISPLTAEESRDYILYRLAKVVMVDKPIFTRGALRKIIKHAQGTPRVINVLCTNALMQGLGYRKRRISTKIINEVIADYTGWKPRRRWRARMALAGTTGLLTALFWVSPYQEVVWSTINLARVRQWMTPAVMARLSPPQEPPAAVPDGLLPMPLGTPTQLAQPPTLAGSAPSPETSEPIPAVPATVAPAAGTTNGVEAAAAGSTPAGAAATSGTTNGTKAATTSQATPSAAGTIRAAAVRQSQKQTKATSVPKTLPAETAASPASYSVQTAADQNAQNLTAREQVPAIVAGND
jgi:general secretion pathway protein A